MSYSTIHNFAAIASQVIGDPDRIVVDAAWFCKGIFRKRDLMWTGYLVHIGSEGEALAFGLNLEFIPAWRRIYPKIKGNLQYFSDLLRRYPNYEWNWNGRPGIRFRNPPSRRLKEVVWTNQVDVTKWVSDLEDILERRVMWSSNVPMRPQIGIVRKIGLLSQLTDRVLIHRNIQQVVHDLEPLVAFLGK